MTHPFARFFKSSKTHRGTSLPFGSFLVPRLELLESRVNPSFANMDIIAQSLREAEDALPQIPGLDSNLAQMVPNRLSDALALNNIDNGNTSWSQFDTTYPNPTTLDLQTIAQTISQASTIGGPTVSLAGTTVSAGSAMTSSTTVPVWGVLPDLMLGQYAGFTVQAWFNSTNIGSDTLIIDFGMGSGAGDTNIIVGVKGSQLFIITSNGITESNYTAGPTLGSNTWYHVSAVSSGTTASLYLNGALVGSNTSMAQIKNVARTNNYWGKSNWPSTPAFQGQQDELRIWNRALTAPEIALNYNLSLPSGTPGLLLYYKADETSGQTLTDSSGNNNGGTLETSNNNGSPPIPGGGRSASTVALFAPTMLSLTWTQSGTYQAGFSTGGLDAGLHLNRTGDSTLPIEYTSTLTMTMIVDAANYLEVGVSANWNATANLSGEAISAGLGFLDSSIVGASYSLSASASSVLFDTITQAAAPGMVAGQTPNAAMTTPLSDFKLVGKNQFTSTGNITVSATMPFVGEVGGQLFTTTPTITLASNSQTWSASTPYSSPYWQLSGFGNYLALAQLDAAALISTGLHNTGASLSGLSQTDWQQVPFSTSSVGFNWGTGLKGATKFLYANVLGIVGRSRVQGSSPSNNYGATFDIVRGSTSTTFDLFGNLLLDTPGVNSPSTLIAAPIAYVFNQKLLGTGLGSREQPNDPGYLEFYAIDPTITGFTMNPLNPTSELPIGRASANALSSLGFFGQPIQSVALQNGSFEGPLATSNGQPWLQTPEGSQWNFVGASGLAQNGSPWYSSSTPAGNQAAYFENIASATQTLIGVEGGNYQLSLDAIAGKTSQYVANPIQVLLDGKLILTLLASQLSGTTWGTFTSPVFSLTAGNHTLTLQTLGVSGSGTSIGAVSAIDNVQLQGLSLSSRLTNYPVAQTLQGLLDTLNQPNLVGGPATAPAPLPGTSGATGTVSIGIGQTFTATTLPSTIQFVANTVGTSLTPLLFSVTGTGTGASYTLVAAAESITVNHSGLQTQALVFPAFVPSPGASPGASYVLGFSDRNMSVSSTTLSTLSQNTGTIGSDFTTTTGTWLVSSSSPSNLAIGNTFGGTGSTVLLNRALVNYSFSTYQGLAQAGQGSVSRPSTDTSTANSFVYTGASYTSSFVPTKVRFYANALGTITPMLFSYSGGGGYQVAAIGTSITPTAVGLNESDLFFQGLGLLTPGNSYLFGFQNAATGVVATQAGPSASGGWQSTATSLGVVGNSASFTGAGTYSLDIIGSQVVGNAPSGSGSGQSDPSFGQVVINPNMVYAAQAAGFVLPTAMQVYVTIPTSGSGWITPLLFQQNGTGSTATFTLIASGVPGEVTNNGGNKFAVEFARGLVTGLNPLNSYVMGYSTRMAELRAGGAIGVTQSYSPGMVQYALGGSPWLTSVGGATAGSGFPTLVAGSSVFTQGSTATTSTLISSTGYACGFLVDATQYQALPALMGIQYNPAVRNGRALTFSYTDIQTGSAKVDISASGIKEVTVPNVSKLTLVGSEDVQASVYATRQFSLLLDANVFTNGASVTNTQQQATGTPVTTNVLTSVETITGTQPFGVDGFLSSAVQVAPSTQVYSTAPLVSITDKLGYTLNSSEGFPASANLPDLQLGQYGGGFTLQGWFYNTNIGLDNQRIFDFGNGLLSGLNDISVGITNASLVMQVDSATLNSNQPLSSYQWYQATLVFNGANSAMYINGKPTSTSGLLGVPGNLARSNNYLGRGNLVGDPMWQGQLDEIRIWSVPLTAAEVQSNWDSSFSSAQAGLIANYKTDKTSGSTLEDSSGFGNQGSLVSSVSAVLVTGGTVSLANGVPTLYTPSQISTTAPGLYYITGNVATQPGSQPVTVSMVIDGVPIGNLNANLQTVANGYNFTSNGLFLSPGNHTLSFAPVSVSMGLTNGASTLSNLQWSFRPLVQSTAPIPITGSGATAVANLDVNTGLLSGITLTNTGAGYSNPQIVVQGDRPATASATFLAVGSLVKNPRVTNGGSGYLMAPMVSIYDLDQNGTGATALATINSNGVVTGISITNPGSGYTSPRFLVSGTALQPAAASYLAMTNFLGIGSINALTVQYGGQYYGSAPNVIISDTTGGSGTGGSATVSIQNGMVTGFLITNGGFGYTSPPLVVFRGGGATTGASATSVVNENGILTGIVIGNPGKGYTSAPQVSFSGTGASVSATISNGVIIVPPTILLGGGGYSKAPVVTITDVNGSGSGATAIATIAQGVVTQITLTKGGTNYSNPQITLAAPTGTVGVTATASFPANRLGNGVVTGFTLLNAGAGYSHPVVVITAPTTTYITPESILPIPTVTLTDVANGGSGANGVVQLHLDGTMAGITLADNTATAFAYLEGGTVGGIALSNPGQFYTSAPTVTIADSKGGTGIGAKATASVSLGLILLGPALNVTGSGYTVSPAVTITDPTGTGAVAFANLNPDGSVNSIMMANPGVNYTSPVFTLGAPATGGVQATATYANMVDYLGGQVTGFVMTNLGSGYSSPVVTVASPGTFNHNYRSPTISLPYNLEYAATAIATLGPTGTISNISIPPGGGGSGYSAPPTVTITGGNGQGATAVATLINGVVNSIVVLTLGSGYTTTPTITLTSPNQLATVTATAGRITGIAVPFGAGGAGYLTAPVVHIIDNSGVGAAGTALVANGVVTGIQMTNQGSGYLNPIIRIDAPNAPASAGIIGSVGSILLFGGGAGYTSAPVVTISDSNGGSGSGATATAVLINGVVTGITLTNAGSGYTTPVVVFGGAPAGGKRATGKVLLTFTPSMGSTSSVAILNSGYGYPLAPTVLVQDTNGGNGSGVTASATVNAAGQVIGISFTGTAAQFASYQAPILAIANPPVGLIATGNVTLDSTVAGLVVTNGGSGFTSPPTVTIVDTNGGTGSGATARATLVNNTVTGITIINPGTGYRFPQINLSAPQGVTATAGVSPLSLQLIASGKFYSQPPQVTISGGGGSGATATATITNGMVTALTINNPGSGYTSAPTVTLANPVVATPFHTTGVMEVELTYPGQQYVTAPLVTITDSSGKGTGATAYAVLTAGQLSDIVVTNFGANYSTPVINIAPPTVDLSQIPNGPSSVTHTFYFMDGNSWTTTTTSESGVSLQYQIIDQLNTMNDRAATGLTSANGTNLSPGLNQTANFYNLQSYLTPLLGASPTYALTANLGIVMPETGDAPILWYISAASGADPFISQALLGNNQWNVATLGAVSLGEIDLNMNLTGNSAAPGFTGSAQIGYVKVNLIAEDFTPNIDFTLNTTPGTFMDFRSWVGVLGTNAGLAKYATTSSTINRFGLTMSATLSNAAATLLNLPTSGDTMPNVTFSAAGTNGVYTGRFSNSNWGNAEGMLYINKANIGSSFEQVATALAYTDTSSFLGGTLPFVSGTLQDLTDFSDYFVTYLTSNLISGAPNDLDKLIDWVNDNSTTFTLGFGPVTIGTGSGVGLYLTPIQWSDSVSETTQLSFDVATFAALAGGLPSSQNWLTYTAIPPNNAADLTVSADVAWQSPMGIYFTPTGSGSTLGYATQGYLGGSNSTNAWNLSSISIEGNDLDFQGTLASMAVYFESDANDTANVNVNGGQIVTTLGANQLATAVVASSLGGSVTGGNYSANFPVYYPTKTCYSGNFNISGPTGGTSQAPLGSFLGQEALFNAIVNASGAITSIVSISNGSNYTTNLIGSQGFPPIVLITDAAGQGSGATATATVNSNGTVSLTILTAGTGYVSPVVTLAGGINNANNPTGIPSITFGIPDIDNNDMATFALANSIGDPATLRKGLGALQAALQNAFTLSMAQTSQIIIGTSTSQFAQAFGLYSKISDNLNLNLTPFVPQCDQNASASATIDSNGTITAITMITTGESYKGTTPTTGGPKVNIIDNAGANGGSGASATANMVADGNGGYKVGSITIVNGGSGYRMPLVSIDSPTPGQMSADDQLYNDASTVYNMILTTPGLVLDSTQPQNIGNYFPNGQSSSVSGQIPLFFDGSENPLTYSFASQNFINSTGDFTTVQAIQFPLIVDYTLQNTSIPFSLGMPGIPLSINNPADLNLVASGTATVQLSFGFDALNGLYYVPSSGNQMAGTFNAGPDSDFNTTVNLGLLSGSLSATTGEIFTMPFTTMLVNPNPTGGANQELTLAVINSLTPSALFQTTLSMPTVGLNLDMELKVAGGGVAAAIPGIGNTMSITWTPGQGAPQMSYNNFYLDLGSFISDYMGSLVPRLTPITNGLTPIVNALNRQIPVLSEIIGGDTSLLGLANTFGGADMTFVKVLNAIPEMLKDVTTAVNYLKQNPNLDFHVPLAMVATFAEDFRHAASSLSKPKPKPTNTLPLKQQAIDAVKTFALKYKDGAESNFTDAAHRVVSQDYGVSGGFGISFDILEPANIIGLITGQTVDIFHITFPALTANFSIDESFDLYGPLFLTFGGGVSGKINFAMGMDSAGLEQWVAATINGSQGLSVAALEGLAKDILFQGLYIDGANTSITANGYLSLGLMLNVGVAKAGIEGDFNIDMKMTPNADADGRLDLQEMIQLAGANFSTPQNLFDFSLEGTISADAYLDLWFIKWYEVWHHDFGSITLFDVNFDPDQPTEQAASYGSLYLNMGPTAGRRSQTKLVEDEHFEIRHLGGVAGDETLSVQFYIDGIPQYLDKNGLPVAQIYRNVDKIVGIAGSGDDTIDAAGVLSPTYLDGGDGKDNLIGGQGINHLEGGRGNDTLRGGPLADTILGGEGEDFLHGGGGTDLLDGGLGNDRLDHAVGGHTILFTDGFGRDNLSPTLLRGSTLDFSKVTKNLKVTLGATNTIQIGANHTISWTGQGPEKILLGQGEDTVVFTPGYSSTLIDTGAGRDRIEINAFENGKWVKIFAPGTNGDNQILVKTAASGEVVADNNGIHSNGAHFEFDWLDVRKLNIHETNATVKLNFADKGATKIIVFGREVDLLSNLRAEDVRLDAKNLLSIQADITTIPGGSIGLITGKDGTAKIATDKNVQLSTTHGNIDLQTPLVYWGGKNSTGKTTIQNGAFENGAKRVIQQVPATVEVMVVMRMQRGAGLVIEKGAT